MSLLMDALKKAELEKKKAAEKNAESDSDQTSELTDTQPSTAHEQAEKKEDDSWAFSTDELELEPLSQTAAHVRSGDDKSEETDQIDDLDQTDDVDLLKDDTTLVDLTSNTSDDLSSDDMEEDITLKTDPDLNASDFDHDATLPSERAIQSSLKDYFEASQSITMDQKSVDAAAAAAEEYSDTSRNRIRPLDTSATHVTAHTIFTAGHSRKASTGLAKYALFGSFILALGLGLVALWFSTMTPSVIQDNTTLPGVAKIVESDIAANGVEVDVNTASINPPFEPATSEAIVVTDPVINEVVKEVAELDQERKEAEEKIAQAQAEAAEENTVENIPEPVSNEVVALEQPSQAEEVIEVENATSEVTETVPEISQVVTPSTYEVLDNQVVHYPTTQLPQSDQISQTTEVEEQSIPIAQTYSVETEASASLASTLSEPEVSYVYADDEPIQAVPAEAFEEGLSLPKSAIKITRSSSKRQFNDEVLTAYHAYQRGEYVTAKTIYRQILNRRPDNRDAHLGLAAIDVVEGRLESAYQHYQHLLQRNPQDPVANAALFNLQGQASQNVSESQLKMMLDQHPESAQVHFSLGSFYAKQQRWPEAQQSFFEAISREKTNPDYAYNLAVSLDRMEQGRAALNYYRQALKLAENKRVGFNTSQVLARIQKLSGTAKP